MDLGSRLRLEEADSTAGFAVLRNCWVWFSMEGSV